MNTAPAHLSKNVNNIYRTTKQLPIVFILFFFVPITLFIATPFCIYYWLYKNRLIKKIDQGEIQLCGPFFDQTPSTSIADTLTDEQKIAYLRDHKYDLLAPAFVCILIIGMVTMMLSITL